MHTQVFNRLFIENQDMRLQKVLAQAGVASRRKCEELIKARAVKINGVVATIGQSADPVKDEITVHGRPIAAEKKVYLVLNKPKGLVTTVSESHGMKTVRSLVQVKERVFPVGRLDKDTTGLLLMTNDGDWTNNITHPSKEVEKEYVAVLDRPFVDEKKVKHVVLEGRPVECKIKANGKTVNISLHEGRKHVVKRLFEVLGYKVAALKRIRIGKLELGALKEGQWRELKPAEIAWFR